MKYLRLIQLRIAFLQPLRSVVAYGNAKQVFFGTGVALVDKSAHGICKGSLPNVTSRTWEKMFLRLRVYLVPGIGSDAS